MTTRFVVIKDIIREENPDAMFIEQKFDIALIGTCKGYSGKTVAAYNTDDCLDVLIKEGMDEFDALEHFQGSLEAYPEGPNKPVFISDFRNISSGNRSVFTDRF